MSHLHQAHLLGSSLLHSACPVASLHFTHLILHLCLEGHLAHQLPSDSVGRCQAAPHLPPNLNLAEHYRKLPLADESCFKSA